MCFGCLKEPSRLDIVLSTHAFMVSEDFFNFFIASLWKQMVPGCGQFVSQGHGWQDLSRGPLDIAIYWLD